MKQNNALLIPTLAELKRSLMIYVKVFSDLCIKTSLTGATLMFLSFLFKSDFSFSWDGDIL